jgi:hypothetical protein
VRFRNLFLLGGEQCERSYRSLLTASSRDNKIIQLCGTNVRKMYLGPQRRYQILHLTEIYGLLRDKNVPNVDRIELSITDNSLSESVIYLQPKGICRVPDTVEEIFEAIGCVLEALIVSIHTFWNMFTYPALNRRCTVSQSRYSTGISDGLTL